MPPQKKSYRKRTSRKRNYRGTTRKYIAKVAKQVVMRTKESHNVCTESNFTVGTSANWANLLAVPQSVSADGRIGDTVIPTKVSIRFHAYNASTSEENVVRVFLIQMKRGQGTPSTASFPSVLGCFDQDSLAKFRVLYDKTFTIRQYDSAITGRTGIMHIDKYGRALIKAQWDEGSTGALAPDLGGGLYLCAVSDSIASSHPTVYFGSKVHYKDDS